MDTLLRFSIIDSVYQIVDRHQSLFHSFSNVYLFGSILSLDKIPNDIDILLVYDELTNKVLNDSEAIHSILCEGSGMQVDMIILSQNEFMETNFLRKLNSKYLRIK
mgnify:CR=1 FL=1